MAKIEAEFPIESTLKEKRVFKPDPAFTRKANWNKATYNKLRAEASRNFERFWARLVASGCFECLGELSSASGDAASDSLEQPPSPKASVSRCVVRAMRESIRGLSIYPCAGAACVCQRFKTSGHSDGHGSL